MFFWAFFFIWLGNVLSIRDWNHFKFFFLFCWFGSAFCGKVGMRKINVTRLALESVEMFSSKIEKFFSISQMKTWYFKEFLFFSLSLLMSFNGIFWRKTSHTHIHYRNHYKTPRPTKLFESPQTWKYFSHKLFWKMFCCIELDFCSNEINDSFKIIIFQVEIYKCQWIYSGILNVMLRNVKWFLKLTTQFLLYIYWSNMFIFFFFRLTHLEIVNEHGFGACDRSLVYTIPHWFFHCSRAFGKLSYTLFPLATLYTHQFYN